MDAARALEQGRESFGRRAWANAYAQLSLADHESPLGLDDLERLAVSAQLVGRNVDSADIWARAHHDCLALFDVARAARCAFWLALGLLLGGEQGRAGGWLARARRLLDDGQHDCVEQGYLLVPIALHSLAEGDAAAGFATFGQAAKIAQRFDDTDLVTLARLGRGQALIQLGETAEGVALLDEVMVGLTSDEVSPLVAGIAYCAAIEVCRDVFDVRRAREWTAALTRWCTAQPDLVLYRGQCHVYRAEIMQLTGAWAEAIAEAQRACERLCEPPAHPAAGMALYLRAELHRLRGEFGEAEQAYRQASRWGREPQPGLAQLRLAQGQIDVAAAAVRRVVDEAQNRVARSRLLPAHVEIMLAAGDMAAARAAADELSGIAADLGAPLLHAAAAGAQGAVLLRECAAQAGLTALRQAERAWQDLDAPHEAARVRVLIGVACRELGDEDTAQVEWDAARFVFRQLDAVPDLARVEALSRPAPTGAVGELTAREVQVLVLVATGRTNRAIAGELVLSEHTVRRHIQNIFAKLGVSSRAAATAFAFQHNLVA
jgi:ATP/maltotriose-dependent transcriptional regulator MalT